jgi:hypothetical protein
MYLGDGYVAEAPRKSPFLVITLDERYSGVVLECRAAVQSTVPDTRVLCYPRRQNRSMIVQASDRRWPEIFPQHGPGKKHNRKIELVPWQRELTTRYPKMLLRGLIHSDGCRTMNRFRTLLPSGRVAEYEYPRYFFSNLSADIRRLFTDHCELLGIRWTQSNPRNISISHRRSVALLDSFIGPKT